MRCPYCGGLNGENASFCAQCGRDFPPTQVRQQPVQPPHQQPQQSPYLPTPRPVSRTTPPAQGATTRPAPPYQQPRPPQQQPVSVPRPAPIQQPRIPVPPPQRVVEPPTHFPPHTMTHLRELQTEAMLYTLVGDAVIVGRKKTIRIVYRRCAAWEQVATLLKAFNEQSAGTFDTFIVQGVLEQDTTPYSFTNGQLQFDRGVRLGSQILNRFQIETGNGFESDSVRIVLSE